MSDARTWTLTVKGRCRSLNAERSGHWTLRAAQTEAERRAWFAEARNQDVPSLDVIEVVAQPNYADHPQDTGACYPSVKAAVDGLVDAGIIADDTGEFLLSVTLLAPGSTKVDALTLLIKEVPPDAR